ncbi:hypothetical protein Taro_034134 [Colocasia esculenta]|uniref:Glutamate receptor n=1 Tax=Colocasia esculenta TaxID=4460 RepID=A0A843W215_COLES|nr:hypothetical protein [Colocasia esculenta]
MVYLHPFLCFCVLKLSLTLGMATNTTSVHVGVILDMGTLLGKMCHTTISMAIDDFYDIHDYYTTRLVIHTRDSEEDEAGAAWAALDLLRNVQVQAILGPITSAQAELVADFGKRAQVPIISFSAASPSLSPAQKPYFIRTALHDAHQVNAISSIINHFGFRDAIPICESTYHGAAMLPYLVDALQATGIRAPYRSLISPSISDEQLEKELYDLMNMKISVFIVHMPASLGSRLFLKARDVGLMGNGYIWIVTDFLTNFLHLLDPVVVHSMQGVLCLRPYLPNTEELHNFTARARARFEKDNPGIKLTNINIFGIWAYDAAWALAGAAEKVGVGALVSDNSTAKFSRKLLEVISDEKFNGKSGEIHMVEGQLNSSSFQITNIAGKRQRMIGIWSPTHGISGLGLSNIHEKYLASTMNQEKILWPGDATSASRGWELLASGRKLRIAVPEKSGFRELVDVKHDPVTNATLVTGYCIDVFDTVMKTTLPYSVNYEYVSANNRERWTTQNYNGLLNEVFYKKYDAVVGDTTILANRSFYVDFTLPFTETGVWMVVQATEDGNTNGWIFTKPMTVDLWMGSIAFFCFTGFVVWAIEQRVNLEFREERLQSNFSRVVVIIWVFVVLILTTSYTANLTSMLTVKQLQPPTLTDLLNNGDYIGYQAGSFVGDYLRELNFDVSKLRAYFSPDEYEYALSRGSHNGGVSAIFDEMPYIRVFPRGSTLVPDISRAILNATEMKKLIPVDKKWFGDQTTCSSANRAFSSNKLTFNDFSGLFTISGVVSAACLLFFIGQYIHKNWDELRTVSSGDPLWKRVIAWAKHYSQMNPDLLRSLPPVYGCHGTSSVAAEVADSTPVADAQRNHPGSESTPMKDGPQEETPAASTELGYSPAALERSHNSSIELTTASG